MSDYYQPGLSSQSLLLVEFGGREREAIVAVFEHALLSVVDVDFLVCLCTSSTHGNLDTVERRPSITSLGKSPADEIPVALTFTSKLAYVPYAEDSRLAA